MTSRLAAGVLTLALLLPLAVHAQTTPPDRDQDGDMHALGEPTPDARTLAAQSNDVQTLFAMTNEARAAQSLPALTWNPELAAAAHAHAALMAQASREELSHRYPGEADLATRASASGAHFASIAENIAQGGTAPSIGREWMHSVPHRANILDPRMNALGVAVFAAGGTLYAVEDFAETRPQLTREAIEQQVESELAATGIHLSAQGSDHPLADTRKEAARRSCPLNDAGDGSGAASVVRWQGSDLTLPPRFVEILRSGHYQDVAVGACQPIGSTDHAFALYRVAVLLY